MTNTKIKLVETLRQKNKGVTPRRFLRGTIGDATTAKAVKEDLAETSQNVKETK